MKYIYLFTLLLIASCSSRNLESQLTDSAFKTITGKEYSRDPSHCPRIARQCGRGDYQEWTQEDGQLACACNK